MVHVKDDCEPQKKPHHVTNAPVPVVSEWRTVECSTVGARVAGTAALAAWCWAEWAIQWMTHGWLQARRAGTCG